MQKATSTTGRPGDDWTELTPGERYIIRTSSDVTDGAFSVIEVVADHRNGAVLHIHEREEEHFVILEGEALFVDGDERVRLSAGASRTIKRGVPHAWCNIGETPLRMLLVFSPGAIEEFFRTELPKDGDTASLAPLLDKLGSRIVGPAPFDAVYSLDNPRTA